MTTTPNEPAQDPTVVPSGDPGVGPDEEPTPPSDPDSPVEPGQMPESADPVVNG